jgi:hypothetical protein
MRCTWDLLWFEHGVTLIRLFTCALTPTTPTVWWGLKTYLAFRSVAVLDDDTLLDLLSPGNDRVTVTLDAESTTRFGGATTKEIRSSEDFLAALAESRKVP